MRRKPLDPKKERLPARAQPSARDRVLYVEYKPPAHVCPYCNMPFEEIVGCHKRCRCGYLEGCGD